MSEENTAPPPATQNNAAPQPIVVSQPDDMKKKVDSTCNLRGKLTEKKGFYSWFKTFQFDLTLLGLTNIAEAAIKSNSNLSEHHDDRLTNEKEESFIREYIINTVSLPKVDTFNSSLPVRQTLYSIAIACDYITDYSNKLA
ncbi:unnamed protein product [Ambrosiozyma monospora]|uniref:Unnamed protein product n=1 Tax=Ambrosiozyma monospora TaxID=43982 RepID=A0A9W6WKH3_AMBMO|nr:unnamed protein product [Ambrosiozyma monospora]